jgi:CHASE3 domain sensor protein
MGSLANKFSTFKRFRDFLRAEDKFYGKLLGSSLVGVLAIAMLGAILLFMAFRDNEFESLRARTLDLLWKQGEAENDITKLEAAYRGYLLTGQRSEADAFQHQAALVQTQLNVVADAVQLDGAQSARIADVKRHVTDWLQKTAGPGIEARMRGMEPTAADVTGMRPLLDEARDVLEAMAEEEQQTLMGHGQDQQSLSQSFQILVFAPKLENAISRMQEGEWGYLLNGDRASAEVYQQAVTDFYAFHGHLTVLASQANNPKQLDLLKSIAAITDRWQREVAGPEFAAKAANRDTAEAVANDHGKDLLDTARRQIVTFENAE